MRVSFFLFLVVNMTAVALESQECGIFKDVRFYSHVEYGPFWDPVPRLRPSTMQRTMEVGGRRAKSEALWPSVGLSAFLWSTSPRPAMVTREMSFKPKTGVNILVFGVRVLGFRFQFLGFRVQVFRVQVIDFWECRRVTWRGGGEAPKWPKFIMA